jgi:hypothetical protein
LFYFFVAGYSFYGIAGCVTHFSFQNFFVHTAASPTGLLNVQVSDTTGDDSSNKDCIKKDFGNVI